MSKKDVSSTEKDESGTQAPSSEHNHEHNEARPTNASDSPATEPLDLPREYGGRKGPEPVRYGDWEKNGRCIDF